ncbi:putative bifunctional diguanylate cyclase/phosphodiesterase [Amycolatopsis orientalis]|uniref:putative bifunctional diguanylate cyclase/phosphodiesterase n=1 Tax=Amycolatopsis orientalis TaxID=31958 RepID=UPI00041831AD|nr:EAL domain-containing protein [Amycolatopsis orientalis]
MTRPLPSDGQEQPAGTRPLASRRERVKVARKWAYLISSTIYLPLSHDQIERELLGLLDRLLEALAGDRPGTESAAEVGAELVRLHCVGKTSLQCTVDVLATALLAPSGSRPADRFPERVARLLGALASGYAEAIRSEAVEQRDTSDQALLNAVRESQREWRTSEAQLDEIFLVSPSGIAVTGPDGRLVRTNPALHRILDRTSNEVADGNLFEFVHETDRPLLRDGYRDLGDGKIERLRSRPRFVTKDGDLFQATLTASLLRGSQGYVTIVADDAELMLLQNQLRHQLLHDMLTGLPNRQFFSTHLEHVLHLPNPATLYHVDLDGLSLVTDGLGRKTGDSLLRTAADRLRSVVAGENAMVARFESGKFGILIEKSANTPDVATMIERINETLTEPIYIDDKGLAVTASFGVVEDLPRNVEPAELLRSADLAMRRAKNMGPGRWIRYDPVRDGRARETIGLVAAMPGAWENGELSIGYQPLVRLADGEIAGAEARLRWEHPELGLLPRERYVELAEHTALTGALGAWLVKRGWTDQAAGDLPLLVPLTPKQLADPRPAEAIREILDSAAPAPGRLWLGLPSGALLADGHEIAGNARVLADRGIDLVLLDFGVTPGELTLLEDIPVRAVRLGSRLVRHAVDEDSMVLAGAKTMIALIRQAGITVLAGDLETREQARWWQLAGVELGTGPLFTGDKGLGTDIGSLIGGGQAGPSRGR